jgi:hypothetical protein
MPVLDPVADRPFWPRNPYPIHPRPRTVSVFEEPIVIHPDDTGALGAPTRWTPFGIFVSKPYPGGGHGGRNDLNQVARADMSNSAIGPWPRSGVWDEPNVWPAVMGFLRLPPSTSAHPGAQLTSGEASPTMVFHTPPVWGMQTTPIYAVGV